MTVRFTDNEEELTNYSHLNHYFMINKSNLSETKQNNTKQSIDYDIQPASNKPKSNPTSFNYACETRCEYEESVKYGTQVVDDNTSHGSYENHEHSEFQKVYSELIHVERSQRRTDKQTNEGGIDKEQLPELTQYNQHKNSSPVTSSIWTSILRLFTWTYRNSF
jgi:hypothetical protein